MSRRRPDWAADEARRAYDLMQPPVTREVAVTFLAATLRLASQRGAIEGAKKPAPTKDTLV